MSFTSYRRHDNLLTRWQAYINASAQKDFDNPALEHATNLLQQGHVHLFGHPILLPVSLTV